MRSNASKMVKTYSCGYPRDLGRPSASAVCFNYKYSDGGGCSVVLVVSPPCVSDNGSRRRVNIAARL